MNVIARPSPSGPVVYPDSDGMPMAENTLQYQWIVTIHGNLDAIFASRDDVFVAGDNLIYPEEGRPDVRQAPDVYVAFGRPKGHRGSYRVWEEEGIFPQVVFEILSPGNRAGEMARKFLFYERYGVEEYYIYDPDRNRLEAYTRGQAGLDDVPAVNGFVSPRLQIRFDTSGPELVILRPDGQRFLTFVEIAERADAERQRADAERQRADAERQRADALAARLRELGADPESV
jgi:Uma2 family endonuclease